jgi:hypothetical protein
MSKPPPDSLPRGAIAVSAIAIGLLFLAWLAFYFLLFLPRGVIG